MTPGVPQDIHIVVWPWLDVCNTASYNTSGGNTIALPSGAVTNTMPVAIYQVAPNTDAVIATPTSGLVYPPAMQQGKGRLVAMGLEVINVTAPIQRSGTFFGWRTQGLEEEVESYQYLTAGLLTRVGSTRRCSTPPLNTAQAELLPGTRSWAAEEGAYMVLPFHGDNPPLYPTTVSPIILRTGGTLLVDNANAGQAILTGGANTTQELMRLVPTNLMGCILTGLNDQAKITVNAIWYYEEFPDTTSSVLTLATPSCDFDPLALRLYTEVLNSLPVCVPSSWNTAGDWWWDVVNAIKEHAGKVGMMLGGRQGAVIGGAAATVAGWAQGRYLTSPGSGGSGVPRQRQQTQARVIQVQANQPKKKKKPRNRNNTKVLLLDQTGAKLKPKVRNQGKQTFIEIDVKNRRRPPQ